MTDKGHRNRAYPRRLNVKKDSVTRMEELLAEIPYKHGCRKFKDGDNHIYILKLKTQEVLAMKLAGFEVKR